VFVIGLAEGATPAGITTQPRANKAKLNTAIINKPLMIFTSKFLFFALSKVSSLESGL
jgi:hypothetical protein